MQNTEHNTDKIGITILSDSFISVNVNIDHTPKEAFHDL